MIKKNDENIHLLTEVKNQNQYILKKLANKQKLNDKEVFDVISNIVRGNSSEIFISAFLMSLILNGDTFNDIKGTVEAIRANAIKISPVTDLPIIDNCGTGGDFLNTFNISTAAAIIAASCKKVAVAKHGNRSFSSMSGSADFFEYIGYKLDSEPDLISKYIETYNLGFLFAPTFHPGLKNVSNVRKELGLRTIFNKIGPLCNPCSNLYGQIIGVSDPSLLKIIPKLVPYMGLKNAMIVHSHDGMDELSTNGKNTVVNVTYQNDGYVINETILDPMELGLPKSTIKEIIVEDKLQSILDTLRVIYGISTNESKTNIVLINSAAILLVGNVVKSFEEGISIIKESLNKESPQKMLKTMIKNHGNICKLEAAEKLL